MNDKSLHFDGLADKLLDLLLITDIAEAEDLDFLVGKLCHGSPDSLFCRSSCSVRCYEDLMQSKVFSF
jgi:hypothetical protein